jgi:hypothetical protein
MLLLAMNIEPAAESEYAAWCDEEYMPRLAALPGCLAARRFRGVAGTHRHLVLCHLADAAVAASATFPEAENVPRARKLGEAMRDRLRLVLKPYRSAGTLVP